MRRRCRWNRGATLIETMMAGVIIAIATLGTLGFFVVASRNSSLSWKRSVALRILATRQASQAMLTRLALDSIGTTYQYDVRFDDSGDACLAGLSSCPATAYRYTVCTRRESSAAASPATPELVTIRTRVDWASGSDATGACVPDTALGGQYVSFVYEAAR